MLSTTVLRTYRTKRSRYGTGYHALRIYHSTWYSTILRAKPKKLLRVYSSKDPYVQYVRVKTGISRLRRPEMEFFKNLPIPHRL